MNKKDSMKYIFGLGNPGHTYENTRHNAGFLALDTIAHNSDNCFVAHPRFKAHICETTLAQTHCFLIKPMTYMNESGKTIAAILGFYKANEHDMLVIHDDKDLELGTVKLALQSSSAGQKGVQNIIETLGTNHFARIRIGIGPKPDCMETSAFVLASFDTQEQEKLQKSVFPLVVDMCNTWLSTQ